MKIPYFKIGIGQDGHRFLPPESTKLCTIGGIIFEDVPGLAADSDGDVVLHAICNAITSISHLPILGKIAIDLCHQEGITDSKIYLKKALESLNQYKIEHLAITIEGKRPKFQKRILEMRKKIASLLHVKEDQIGITATSGDGLTDFGCGEGVQCFCILTVFDERSVDIS